LTFFFTKPKYKISEKYFFNNLFCFSLQLENASWAAFLVILLNLSVVEKFARQTAQDEIVVNICGEDVQRIMQRCVVINDFSRALWHVSFLNVPRTEIALFTKNRTDIYRPQFH